ncbi:MAG: FCD domain-containing protein [Desulfobacterales bacterium]|nr:FCD domain-containing protein [Desulfobacterales bacterium]
MKNNKEKEKIQILTLMKQCGIPVGSIYLAEQMNAASATIGRILIELENEQLIRKVGVKGRILTPMGEKFLAQAEQRQSLRDSADKLANIHLNLSKETLIDIMDVRLLLEPRAAELACRYGTEEQFRLLDQSVLEYKLQVSRGSMGDEPGMQMHLLLAEMSGNHVLQNICVLLLAQNNAHNIFSQIVEKEEVLATQVVEHEMIVSAVKARDAKTAKRLLYDHINRSRSYVLDLKDYNKR